MAYSGNPFEHSLIRRGFKRVKNPVDNSVGCWLKKGEPQGNLLIDFGGKRLKIGRI